MRKNKFKGIVLVWLILLLLISMSPMVSAGKSTYWIVTDGVIPISSDFHAHSDPWTYVGLEERYADFKWYVDRATTRGGSLTGDDKPIGGTKAKLSMSGSGNDWILIITIYKGGAKNPSGGPETYQWTIINGKDSTNDCINVVFTNMNSGKSTDAISLYEGDIVNIGIPNVLQFQCRMWLI